MKIVDWTDRPIKIRQELYSNKALNVLWGRTIFIDGAPLMSASYDDFIGLDSIFFQGIKSVPLSHGLPDFMAHKPYGPVRLDPQLFLQVQHGDAFLGCGHQKDRPEPFMQRKPCFIEGGSGRQIGLFAAGSTLQDSPGSDIVQLLFGTGRTRE